MAADTPSKEKEAARYPAKTVIALSMTRTATLVSGQNRAATFQEVVTIDAKPDHVDERMDYSTGSRRPPPGSARLRPSASPSVAWPTW
jgi:hypothetical protein